MNKLLLTLTLVLATATSVYAEVKKPNGVLHELKILRVVDGDTVEIEAPFLIDPLPKKLSVRVWGVDTPEKGGRASCEKEAKLGEEATAFAKSIIKVGDIVQVHYHHWDKFGGRIDADVFINGENFAQMQIDKGLARPYFGEKKKSWCD